jgi:parvulin-like peptidyl-prolyl isomerase
MSKVKLLILTAVVFLAGCSEEPKYTAEELAAMPFAKKDGLPEPSGGFALVVGGQTVTADEVIGPVFEKLSQAAQRMDFEKFRRASEPVIEQEIVNRISDAILYSRAKNDAGEQVDAMLDQAVNTEVRRFVTNFGGDYARAEEALRQMGMDWGKFEDYQRRRILSQSYIAQQMPKESPITYSEMLAVYNKTKDVLYTAPGVLQFRLIDIEPAKLRDVDPNRPRLEQARALAGQIVGRIKLGGDFEQLAKKYSNGYRASAGGLWRKLAPESLAAPYDLLVKEAAKMKPGEVTGPIETEGHIFIMQLMEYHQKSVEPFEKVQNQVKAAIQAGRLRQYFEKFNSELLQQASAADKARFVDFCVRKIYVMANG